MSRESIKSREICSGRMQCREFENQKCKKNFLQNIEKLKQYPENPIIMLRNKQEMSRNLFWVNQCREFYIQRMSRESNKVENLTKMSRESNESQLIRKKYTKINREDSSKF